MALWKNGSLIHLNFGSIRFRSVVKLKLSFSFYHFNKLTLVSIHGLWFHVLGLHEITIFIDHVLLQDI